MRIKQGTIAKDKGMALAAEQRLKSLRMAREYLYELAQKQEFVTADDAQAYIERERLSPLGNVAGSLFKEKHWEFTGEWEPSTRSTNHAHLNRVYRLRVGAARISARNPTPTPQQTSVAPSVTPPETQQPQAQHDEIRPLNPVQARQQFKALEDMYEHTEMT